MDNSEQRTIETVTHVKRRRRSVEEKRRIVEETLGAGDISAGALADFERWLGKPGGSSREVIERQRIRAILGIELTR
jgi:hypothetical protein